MVLGLPASRISDTAAALCTTRGGQDQHAIRLQSSFCLQDATDHDPAPSRVISWLYAAKPTMVLGMPASRALLTSGDGAGGYEAASPSVRSPVRQTGLPERMDTLVKNSTFVGERTRAIVLVIYPSISQTSANASGCWLCADYATGRPCLCLTPSARTPRQIVRDEPIQ